MKTRIAILALLAAMACSRDERPGNTASESAQDGAASTPMLAVAAAPPVKSATRPAGGQPMIVRSAEMRVVVEDTTKAMEAVTAAVDATGGFVAQSKVWREGELLRANVTLRVPSEKLSSTLASIRALSKRVESESISSDDVSTEFVDLEATLRNLEATETELRALLAVARERSKKAADVLEVHEQLMVIRGQIEQIRGRMRYLSERSALSSVTLDLVPDAIAQPVVEPGWQPLVVAKEAARALVGVLRTLATAAIWLLIYAVPLLGILLLGAGGIWLALRRRLSSEG